MLSAAESIIHKVTKLLTHITTPCPSLKLSQSESFIISQRIRLFLVQTLFLASFKVFVSFYPRIAEVIEVNYRILLVLAIIMLSFCRTHPRLIKFVLALHYSFTYSYLATTSPTKVFNFFGFNITILFICMIYTESFLWVLFGLAVQLYTLNTAIKENLITYLYQIQIEEFVEDFVQKTSYFIAVSGVYIMTYFFFVRKLRNQVFEEKAKADNAFNKLKQFIQSFSHEIRNPINSLIGNLDLALDEPLTKSVSSKLKTAKVCTEILLQLINNILDSGKAEIGLLEINPTPTNILMQISKVWSVTNEIIKKKGLNGYITVAKNVPKMLKLDSTRLSQVIMNLLGNSSKFTERGQIRLSLSWINKTEIDDSCFTPPDELQRENDNPIMEQQLEAISRNIMNSQFSEYKFLTFEKQTFSQRELDNNQPGTEQKGLLKIEVLDTGVGISPENQKKLFKKFAQVGDNASHSIQGSGLGLFITKHIIETMKGEIRVFSVEGRGTAMTACIPSKYSPEFEATLHCESEVTKLQTKQLKAMVVDSSCYSTKILNQLLEKLSIQVEGLSYNGLNGYESYKKLVQEGKKIDMIISETKLPILNGPEMCEKIRKYEQDHKLQDQAVKLVLLGNHDEDFDKQDAKHDCLIKKPLNYQQFVKELSKLFIKPVPSSGSIVQQ